MKRVKKNLILWSAMSMTMSLAFQGQVFSDEPVPVSRSGGKDNGGSPEELENFLRNENLFKYTATARPVVTKEDRYVIEFCEAARQGVDRLKLILLSPKLETGFPEIVKYRMEQEWMRDFLFADAVHVKNKNGERDNQLLTDRCDSIGGPVSFTSAVLKDEHGVEVLALNDGVSKIMVNYKKWDDYKAKYGSHLHKVIQAVGAHEILSLNYYMYDPTEQGVGKHMSQYFLPLEKTRDYKFSSLIVKFPDELPGFDWDKQMEGRKLTKPKKYSKTIYGVITKYVDLGWNIDTFPHDNLKDIFTYNFNRSYFPPSADTALDVDYVFSDDGFTTYYDDIGNYVSWKLAPTLFTVVANGDAEALSVLAKLRLAGYKYVYLEYRPGVTSVPNQKYDYRIFIKDKSYTDVVEAKRARARLEQQWEEDNNSANSESLQKTLDEAQIATERSLRIKNR